MNVELTSVTLGKLPRVPTFVGICCREWVLAVGHRGRCGLCGTAPVFLRRDS